MGTGTGDIVWDLECIIVPMSGDTVVLASDSVVYNIASNSQYDAIITSFTPITMTGYTESTIVLFALRRLSAANTLAGRASLNAIDFHFLQNKQGTVNEFS
jgi:hypothetical protein